MKEIKQFTKLFVSVFIIATGIVFIIKSGMGADPLSMLIEGVSSKLDISFGAASLMVSLGLICIASLNTLKHIGIGSAIHMIFVGLFINVIIKPLNNLYSGDLLLINILLVLLGIILLGFGSGLYININKGLGAYDMIGVTTSNYLKKPLGSTRMTIDFLFVIVGFLLGGTLGIGTFVAAMLTGRIIQLTIFKLEGRR